MSDQKAGFGWKLLSFFIPILGIILYFAWKNTRPVAAKGVLIAGILSILLYGVGGGIISGVADAMALGTLPAAIVQTF